MDLTKIQTFNLNSSLCSEHMRAKGVGRPRGCAPCRQEHTNKTRVEPDIPTKSYTCMSTSWLLGNVYTAKSCKGEKRVPYALKSGLVS